MARSRKVDAETALSTAVGMFAETGYAGISTREIEVRCGITRFMLQTEYGGKKTLYIKALDAYLDSFEIWLKSTVADGGLAELAGFFRARINDKMMTEKGRYGCFMLTTTSEFGVSDPDITARANRYFKMFRDIFGGALKQAVDAGNTNPHLDIDAETEALIAGIVGLNTYIRAMGDNAAGAPMAEALAARIETLARCGSSQTT